jgi:CRP/FNR family cyclic AMP-dependent transcriptional regulator
VDWNLSPIEFIGLTGTALTIATYLMRTMIRLRVAALLGSIAFAIYGILTGSLTMVVTEALLFPINALRLYQVRKLVDQVGRASTSDFSMDWLRPYGRARPALAGSTLFDKGAHADCLYFIVEGSVRLRESGIKLGAGEIVGEMGLVAPGHKRTQTVDIIEDGVLIAVDYTNTQELHFQSPEFSFYFLRLITGRLFSNLDAAHARIEELEKQIARGRKKKPAMKK